LNVVRSEPEVGTVFGCLVADEVFVDLVEEGGVGVFTSVNVKDLRLETVFEVVLQEDFFWWIVNDFELH
jgi:hypothetical protein